jgi:EAL domain-containing protein (putative c-di-GMP-specific phosphodiesterase class I)
VEALLRWADPERGLVTPDQFLPALEDSGLIVPVGEWVIEQACRQNKLWHDAFPNRELLTTVNVSPRQLARPDFMERVLSIVRDTGATPSRLCLEMTEGSVMRDIDTAWGMLRDAKEADIKLALDDFGTGYSSLGYLARFPVDIIKMDRSFLVAGASPVSSGLATAVIGLGKTFDLDVVAEGIEVPEQWASLRDLGCELGQGFFFARPMDSDAAIALVRSGAHAPNPER